MKWAIILIVFGMVSFTSCEDDPIEQPYQTTPVDFIIPDRFPEIQLPADNPLTVEGIQLGRLLYYDPIVHKDSAKSCASCHIQSNSFSASADNCMPHLNFAWQNVYLWNGHIEGSLEDIMLFEVADFFEMDLERINRNSFYKKKFKEAFNVDVITHQDAANALAQFLRTLVSSNSKFDKRLRGEVNLSPEEYSGYAIFNTEKGDCFHCHGGILLTDLDFHNNGLDATFTNLGWGETTGDPKDYGKFKTPTLRNIDLTAPYMHDGRFQTLEEVVEFYSSGLVFSNTIDALMKNVHQGGLQLTEQEKSDLVAFLKTLTDDEFLNNPDYSSPF